MSSERDKLEQLLQRIEELVVVLSKISEDLRTVSASLKSLAVLQITQPPSKTAGAPVSNQPHKKTSLEDVRMAFPEELDNLLGFEEKGDYIVIKPRGFLGSENFAKIASTVRGMGGEYISAGKDSHFRILKKGAQ
jgi:hypothetical protein